MKNIHSTVLPPTLSVRRDKDSNSSLSETLLILHSEYNHENIFV